MPDAKKDTKKKTKKKPDSPKKNEKPDAGKALIGAACSAYGIDQKFMLAARVDEDGAAVVVTAGGTKVRYAKGDEVEKLDAVRVTGVNPKAKKRKVVAGKER